MNNKEKLIAERADLVDAAAAIMDDAKAEGADMTADEQTAVDEKLDQADTLTVQIDAIEKVEARELRLAAAVDNLKTAAPRRTEPAQVQTEPHIQIMGTPKDIPTSVRRWGKVNNFHGPDAEFKAFRAGAFLLAADGNPKYIDYCNQNGMPLAVHKESNNDTGGLDVPDEIDANWIVLREAYGVFRRNARIVPMTSDVKGRNRWATGLTAYFEGEGGTSASESTRTKDRVNLVAKKLKVITTYTDELSEDAVISVGDELSGEIAYAFALKEDQCGILGDGTSTYGGITGLKSALTAATASLVTGAAGTDDDYSGFTLANFNDMVGLLPEYADSMNAKWYCHKVFFGQVMQKLMYAAGGNTVSDVGGSSGRQFLGYPVEVSQVMPSSGTATVTDIVCALGDLRMACDFGDRRQTTISFSRDATVNSVSMFEAGEVALLGTERFDINVHDVGDTSDAGPMVGLLTAVS